MTKRMTRIASGLAVIACLFTMPAGADASGRPEPGCDESRVGVPIEVFAPAPGFARWPTRVFEPTIGVDEPRGDRFVRRFVEPILPPAGEEARCTFNRPDFLSRNPQADDPREERVDFFPVFEGGRSRDPFAIGFEPNRRVARSEKRYLKSRPSPDPTPRRFV